MTALAPQPTPTRPASAPRPGVPPREPQPSGAPAALSLAAGPAVVALLLAACLPLDQVFVERSWVAPVVSAALVALGLAWAARRTGLGPVAGLAVSALGWVVYAGLAFLPDTLAGGILPSADTLSAGAAMWAHGVELLKIRPAPAVAETALVLVTATGVWWVAYAVHELVFRVRAPLRAVLLAVVLWVVPLGLSSQRAESAVAAVPLLGATALLLLACSGADVRRWGHWSPEPAGRVRWRGGVADPLGWLLAIVAIAGGVALAPLLPGWTDPALYELRDLGGSTVTTNPIVTIRASLLDPDPTPVLRVRTARPVYLRLTSLDHYSEVEEWTNQGIRGRAFRPGTPLPFEVPIARHQQVPVEVRVDSLRGAVLVPAPYQPVSAEAIADAPLPSMQYDRRLSTFTLEHGTRLAAGDGYRVTAALPDPAAADLDRVPAGWYQGPLTALPGNVPAEVAELARRIVDEAGATTPFRQAIAVQEELRSWTYSLDPPQGHGGAAMRTFLGSRQGYCEQFAGTMAVMLRTLGVPARVGVGFTPGSPVGDGEYLVRAGNAHAWVEVLFPGEGWVAFEPTPRSDGNVLVPSPTNLAPSVLAGQNGLQDLPDDDPQATGPDPLPSNRPTPEPNTATDQEGAGEGGGNSAPLLLAGALLAGLLGAGVAAARGHRADVAALGPADRVVHAVRQVERVALGLGRPRRPVETDREFLGRVSRSEDVARLAEQAEHARYATRLPITAITQAEAAAASIVERLLYPLDRRRRLVVRWRAWWIPLRQRVQQRVSDLVRMRLGRTQPWPSRRS